MTETTGSGPDGLSGESRKGQNERGLIAGSRRSSFLFQRGWMVGLLACLAAGTYEVATAQVSSDGDMVTVGVLTGEAGGGKNKTLQTARAVVWALETSTSTIADVVVTGDKPGGGLRAHTEYQHFSTKAMAHLDDAWFEGEPLYFRRVKPGGVSPLVDGAKPSGARRIVSRAFTVDPDRSVLSAAPRIGRFLFHLESRVGATGRRVDHILVVQVVSGAAPRLEWFVSTRGRTTTEDTSNPEAADRRWAVNPAGTDPGRLTPIDEAVGYRLIPVGTRGSPVDG